MYYSADDGPFPRFYIFPSSIKRLDVLVRKGPPSSFFVSSCLGCMKSRLLFRCKTWRGQNFPFPPPPLLHQADTLLLLSFLSLTLTFSKHSRPFSTSCTMAPFLDLGTDNVIISLPSPLLVWVCRRQFSRGLRGTAEVWKKYYFYGISHAHAFPAIYTCSRPCSSPCSPPSLAAAPRLRPPAWRGACRGRRRSRRPRCQWRSSTEMEKKSFANIPVLFLFSSDLSLSLPRAR